MKEIDKLINRLEDNYNYLECKELIQKNKTLISKARKEGSAFDVLFGEEELSMLEDSLCMLKNAIKEKQ